MKKTVIYAVLLSLISLAAGTVLGVAIERANKEHRRHGFMEMIREGRGKFQGKKEGMFRQMMLEKLSRKLELTAAQQEKVKAVLEEAHTKVLEAKKGAFDKLSQIREEASGKIKELLDPAQREKYDKMILDLKSRFSSPKGCASK